MKVTPLTDNEGAPGLWGFQIDFSYRDIPAGIANNTSNTTWPIALPQLAAGDEIMQMELHLITPFENTADAAFNSDTLSFGDAGSATRFFSAVELNKNGTYVVDSNYSTPFFYTAAGQFVLTMNSMTAKSLSNLNAGKAVIYVKLFRAGAKAKNLDLSKPAYV